MNLRAAATVPLMAALGTVAVSLSACSEEPTAPLGRVQFSVSTPEKLLSVAMESLGIRATYALDLSESGVVVGGKRDTGGEQGFLWSRATGEQRFGSLGDPMYTVALGTNARGEIVGSSTPSGARNRVAFLRSPAGVFQAIGPLDTYSFAHDINNAGMVVGSVNLGPTTTRAFRWTSAGGMEVLPEMGGGFSVAYAVNRDGMAVGTSNRSGTLTSEPVAWSPSSELRRLPVPSGVHGVAFDVNTSGQAVGVSFSSGPDPKQRALLWGADGAVGELGSLGGGEAVAWGINDHGEVVGGSLAADGAWHAFYWSSKQGMVDLGMLPDARYSIARRINDSGQIVGFSGGSTGDWVTLWTVQRGKE